MAYGNEILKVCRLENGLEVEIYEQPMPKKGSKDKSTRLCRQIDEPWKAYAFESEEAALTFITEKLPGLRRKTAQDEYNDTFDEVTKP